MHWGPPLFQYALVPKLKGGPKTAPVLKESIGYRRLRRTIPSVFPSRLGSLKAGGRRTL